jgi:hypothetical protein
MPGRQHSRREQLAAIWNQSVFASWVGVTWVAYGFFAAVRDEFFPAKWQESIRGIALIGPALNVPLVWWLVVMLAIAVLWMFEASYRAARVAHIALADATASNPQIVPARRNRRFITTDEEAEDLLPDDQLITIRRRIQSNFLVRLPPNPAVEKEIEIKLASGDKTLTVTVVGRGAKIDGQDQDWIGGPGALHGYRFSGVEWERF